jgi:putative transposase
VPVKEVWWIDGIRSATYYKGKANYEGLETSDTRRMRELEAKNSRLKQMYAGLSLEHRALQDRITKTL